MKLFKKKTEEKKYSVCLECKVHFEPDNSNWGLWCHSCRKPILEKKMRKEAVLEWAGKNWEILEPFYKKETIPITIGVGKGGGVYTGDGGGTGGTIGGVYEFR